MTERSFDRKLVDIIGPRCPKTKTGAHYWVQFIERKPRYRRGTECKHCGCRLPEEPRYDRATRAMFRRLYWRI